MNVDLSLRVLESEHALSPHTNFARIFRLAGDPAAPDVARDVFTERAHRIAGVNAGITLFASSADKCLIASKVKAGGVPRAGDIPVIGPLLLDGVDLIDATLLGDDIFKLNHDISNRSVLADMGRIVLSQTRPPHVRTPTLRRMPDRTSTKYWMYPL